jgi:type IV pilus assembly protein PilC
MSHNFATMYSSGMNIHDIFDVLTDNVLGNRYLEECLADAFNEIQGGQSISAAFEATGSFPPFLLGAIRNGELTGTIDDAFNRLGDYYDVEVKRTVEAMINAIEPMTIILLGGVFGLIALSIMLPLYDVVGQVGQAY